MNLKELIESTNQVQGRSQTEAFKKKYGVVYNYNKTVNIAGQGNVIVVNMLISGVTDMVKFGGRRQPVPFHKVSIALNLGDEQKGTYKIYTPQGLVSAIKKAHPNEEDEVGGDLLRRAEEKPTEFFPGYTIFKMAGKSGNYVKVKNLIPKDCEIQVWCSCSDYYWTFEYYNIHTKNSNDSSLNYSTSASSKYPRTYNYQTKAGKKSTRPMRNPGRHPGMCKHLMLLAALLFKDKLVTDPQEGLLECYEADFTGTLNGRISKDAFQDNMAAYRKGQKALTQQRLNYSRMYGNK